MNEQTVIPHQDAPTPSVRIAALIGSGDMVDQQLAAIVARAAAAGLSLQGILRADDDAGDALFCNLHLRDVASGEPISVEQDLGCVSEGCRLDDVALDREAARIEAAIDETTDLLLLNKFGKREADGRGLCAPLVRAMERGVPVVIGVPALRLEAWRCFAGDAAATFDPADQAFECWLADLVPALRV